MMVRLVLIISLLVSGYVFANPPIDCASALAEVEGNKAANYFAYLIKKDYLTESTVKKLLGDQPPKIDDFEFRNLNASQSLSILHGVKAAYKDPTLKEKWNAIVEWLKQTTADKKNREQKVVETKKKTESIWHKPTRIDQSTVKYLIPYPIKSVEKTSTPSMIVTHTGKVFDTAKDFKLNHDEYSPTYYFRGLAIGKHHSFIFFIKDSTDSKTLAYNLETHELSEFNVAAKIHPIIKLGTSINSKNEEIFYFRSKSNGTNHLIEWNPSTKTEIIIPLVEKNNFRATIFKVLSNSDYVFAILTSENTVTIYTSQTKTEYSNKYIEPIEDLTDIEEVDDRVNIIVRSDTSKLTNLEIYGPNY